MKRKNSKLYLQGRRQRAIGYDFSPMMGDPFEGFGSEGVVVRGGNFSGTENFGDANDDNAAILVSPEVTNIEAVVGIGLIRSMNPTLYAAIQRRITFNIQTKITAEAKTLINPTTGEYRGVPGGWYIPLTVIKQSNPVLGTEIERQMAIIKQKLLAAQAANYINEAGQFRGYGWITTLEAINDIPLRTEIERQMVAKTAANFTAQAKLLLSSGGNYIGIIPLSLIQESNPKLATEIVRLQGVIAQELLAENARNYMAQSNPLVPIDRLRVTNPALANEVDRQIALKAGKLNSAYQNRLIAHGFSPLMENPPTDADMDKMDQAADQATDMARVAALAPNLTAADVRAFRFVMGAAGQEPIYDDQIEANACRVWKNEQEEIARQREIAWVAELKDRIEHPERHVFKSKGFFAVLGRAFTSVILPVLAVAAPIVAAPLLLSSVPVIGGAVSSAAAVASSLPVVSSVLPIVSTASAAVQTVKSIIPTEAIKSVQSAVNAGSSIIDVAKPSPPPATSSVIPQAPVVTPKPEYAVAAKVAEVMKPKPRYEHPMLLYGLIKRRT